MNFEVWTRVRNNCHRADSCTFCWKCESCNKCSFIL